MDTTKPMKAVRNQSWMRPMLGGLAAVAAITAIIAAGLPDLIGVLSLIPLMVLFWYLGRYSRAEIGLVWGRLSHYGMAVLYPLLVFGVVGSAAWMAGVVNLENADWTATALKLAITIPVTILLAIVTEEGFFRGWLYSSSQRAGLKVAWIVVWTSLLFAVWHLPVAFLDPAFTLPVSQAPIYIINVVIAGVIFALMRAISGSIIVASVSHGFWNGIGYELFGFGAEAGVLGIQDSSIFRPEVGLLGLGLNFAFALGLWLWYRRAEKKATANARQASTPGLPEWLDDVPATRS